MTENEVKDLLETLLRADTESEVLEFKEAKRISVKMISESTFQL